MECNPIYFLIYY